ncbi:MAG: hypothetical protein R6V20_08290 [Desulfobia sp.]
MDLIRKIFWEYRPGLELEDIPGPVRAQRFTDYWPEIHQAYKRGELTLQDVRSIIATIERYGPVRYSEPVRQYVINFLIKKWMNDRDIIERTE